MLNGVQLGPMSEAEARALPLTPDTPVWSEGFPDWKPASQVEAFASMFGYQGEQQPFNHQQAYQPPYQQPYQPQPQPAYQQQYNDIPPMPQTYLVWSILATIFCCLPFGIVAIVYSSGVESAYNRGDYATAASKSKTALNWIIASAITGVLVIVANVITIMTSGFLAGFAGL